MYQSCCIKINIWPDIQSFIFSDFLSVWKRSWQLTPLLWPLPPDSYNTGLITHVPTDRSHRTSTYVTALRSAHLLLPSQRQQQQLGHRIHQRALWWNWSLQSIWTSEAIGTAAAAEEEKEASGVLCLVCDLSIFRQELGMGSICYRQLIFHHWPSRDERAEGGERRRGRRDDDKALQSSRGVNPESG